MRNILFPVQVILLIHQLDYGGTNSSDEEFGSRKKRTSSKWPPETDAQLTELYKKHKSDEPHHFERVKNEWYNLNPNSNMSTHALHHRFVKIYQRLEGNPGYHSSTPSIRNDKKVFPPTYKGKRTKREYKWDKAKREDLIDAYLHTYPFNKTCSVHLSDEWRRRDPDAPHFNNKLLGANARRWMKEKKLDVEAGSSKRFFGWTSGQDSDLIHTYKITLPEGQRHASSIYGILTYLHPDLRTLTADQMKERIEDLQRNPPDKHFPWSEEQNRELLEIYHSTSPEIANQEQRIYDIWTKRHPRYKFLTPYYLQVHASTLAHNEAASQSDKKIVAIFTNEQKKNLVNMYRELAKPHKLMYDFHKAWVREYPSLAYISPSHLAWRAKKLVTKDDPSDTDVVEGRFQSEPTSSYTRKYKKYTPQEKDKLLDTYFETLPNLHGHSKRIFKKWNEENRGVKKITDQSLKVNIRRWMQDDLKKKGKEPLETPRSGVEPESSSSASDMLQ